MSCSLCWILSCHSICQLIVIYQLKLFFGLKTYWVGIRKLLKKLFSKESALSYAKLKFREWKHLPMDTSWWPFLKKKFVSEATFSMISLSWLTPLDDGLTCSSLVLWVYNQWLGEWWWSLLFLGVWICFTCFLVTLSQSLFFLF